MYVPAKISTYDRSLVTVFTVLKNKKEKSVKFYDFVKFFPIYTNSHISPNLRIFANFVKFKSISEFLLAFRNFIKSKTFFKIKMSILSNYPICKNLSHT